MVGYSGYGDGKSGDLTDSISDEMRADWANNREALLKFWASGEPTTARIFPDSKPWLFVCGSPDTLPWAERQFSGSLGVLLMFPTRSAVVNILCADYFPGRTGNEIEQSSIDIPVLNKPIVILAINMIRIA